MAWIKWIHEDEAQGRLKEIFKKYRTQHSVDHILKIHSLNPESLVQTLRLGPSLV